MRFTRLSLDRLGLVSVAVLQIFIILSCGGQNPVAPQLTPTVDSRPAVAATTSGRVSAQNDPPNMVLRTTPPVDPERGAVSGPAPLTVLFNVCRSSDPDPDDTLNYQFNFGDSGRPAFNPDGTFNADFNHFCRTEHVYRSPGTYTATVSVTDKHLEDQGRDVSALARQTQTVTILASRPGRGTLTIAKAGTGTGTVTGSGINCGATCFAPLPLGTGVSLSAVPDPGSVFTGWSLPSCGSNSACAFTLTDSTTLTAVFDLSSGSPPPPPPPGSARLQVVKTGTGAGTVTGNGILCGVECALNLPIGTAVSLSAAAAEDSLFAGWSLPACGTSNPCTFTLTANTIVTATFNLVPPPPPEMATLTVQKAGGGTGTVTGNGINCGATCAMSLPVGTAVSLSAAAADGSLFAGWSLPACGTGNPCTFTLGANTTVTATFDLVPPPPPPTATLTVAKDGGGTGTVTGNGISCGATCAVSLPVGTAVSLSAAAAPDSTFAGWSLPACGANPACSFTLTGDVTVTAAFQLQPVTLIVANDAQNSSLGPIWTLSGVVISGPQTVGPLGPVAPGGSVTLPNLLPGTYTAQSGLYYPISVVCLPAVTFTVSPGSARSVHYTFEKNSLGIGKCVISVP